MKPLLKVKKAKIRTKIHKIIQYRDCPIYLRRIGKEYFEYLVIINNQIYTSYVIMTPGEGKKKLTKNDINNTFKIVLTGAVTTIDFVLDKDKKKDTEVNENDKPN